MEGNQIIVSKLDDWESFALVLLPMHAAPIGIMRSQAYDSARKKKRRKYDCQLFMGVARCTQLLLLCQKTGNLSAHVRVLAKKRWDNFSRWHKAKSCNVA